MSLMEADHAVFPPATARLLGGLILSDGTYLLIKL